MIGGVNFKASREKMDLAGDIELRQRHFASVPDRIGKGRFLPPTHRITRAARRPKAPTNPNI